MAPSSKPFPSSHFQYLAYVSEPITRCPPREKGRIRNLIEKMSREMAEEPFLTQLYIPSMVTSPEVRDEMTAEHVYLLDRIRVVESDFMLVVADHASFGIGGEVEMATSLGKPVIIFSRDDTLSRFLVGTPANASRAHNGLSYLKYREWRDLKPKLFEVVEKVLAELQPALRGGIPFVDVGKQLSKLLRKRKMSVEDLAASTGLRPRHLTLLEKPFDVIREELAAYEDADIDLGAIDFTPHQIEELANFGLPALHKLAVALEVSVSTLLGDQGETIRGASGVAATQRRRLREIRTEGLNRRAAQYDVTYREYETLKQHLVDEVVDGFVGASLDRARNLQIVDRKEFLDALANVRGTVL